jgi:hypothetical protein
MQTTLLTQLYVWFDIRNRTNRQYNDQTKMEKQYDLHNTAQKTIDKKQI